MPKRRSSHPALTVRGVVGASQQTDGTHTIYMEKDSAEVRSAVRKLLGVGARIKFVAEGRFEKQKS